MGIVCLILIMGSALLIPAFAAAAYTVTPSTWNIIGLDSNTPASGPYRFPVGAKICGGTPGATDTASFTWDTGGTDNGAYIYLRSGSANPVSITFGADGCADAYFEVEVNRNDLAYNKTRRYYITAGGVSTPRPCELYVERIVSQSRNYVQDVQLNGVSVPAGGAMNLMVGNTYEIKLVSKTATQGYEQLETFINFPNTIFQVLSVKTIYSADSSPNVPLPGPDHEYLYADGCGWENDPNNPNYRACNGDGKAGGDITTTYTVRILSGGGTSQTLSSLIYDFSGSSFHYNADYSTGARIANVVGPSSVTINKTFTPNAILPNSISTMKFRLTNPTSETFTNVNFTDTFPSGLVVATLPNVTYSGCGAGAFSPALVGGATSASFSGATLSPNSTCTITVDVSAPAGTYINTTGNLYINSTVNTGNTGSDTLTASFAPACAAGSTSARWTVPPGAVSPPDTIGGIPTIKGSGASSAVASLTTAVGDSAIDTTGGYNDTHTWKTWGWKDLGVSYILFKVDTSQYSGSSMSFWARRAAVPGPTPIQLDYSTNNGGSYSAATSFNLTAAYQQFSINIPSNNTVWVRIRASGANNNNTGADMFVDDILFTGCYLAPPPPTISKSFLSNPIVKGNTSTLRLTINNTSSGNQPLTGVTFTDVLPAGLSVAESSSSQCGGTLTTAASTRTIALTGGSLAAGGSCTINVTVTGTTEGQYQNVSGNISATESGSNTGGANAGYASASLTVNAPPVLAKSFSPTSIYTTETSTLTFTITNPNQATTLNGIGFTDTLPVGLTISDSTTSQCGGTNNLVTTASMRTIALTGGSLALNSSCTFSITVTGTTSGTKTNTTTAVTSTEGGNGNTASASIVVNDRTPSIDMTKQVSASPAGTWKNYVAVAAGSNVYYRFKVYNSGDTALYNIGITETGGSISPSCSWPEPLAVGDTAYCVSGAVTAVAGLNVNTAYAIAKYPSGGAVYTSSSSSATYATTELTLVKSSTETSFNAAGDVLHYNYLVTNTGYATLAGPLTVADDKTSATCPALSTIGDYDNYFDPGESITCTATYTVTAADVTAKQVTNIASATVGGVTSPTSSHTVSLALADLMAAKNNNVGGTVEVNGQFIWTLTVSNKVSAGSAPFTDGQILLIDNLPESGATYTLGTVKKSGATGTINCSIAANTLTCAAAGSVTIPPKLQGTVAVTNGSATVTGTGTAFTTQLAAGSVILISGLPYTVLSISSDTALTLTVNYSGVTASGLAVPGSFSVPVTVTVTAGGSLVNPKNGGICKADPQTLIAETDENNNNCTDTVTVGSLPSLTVIKSVQTYSDPINNTTNPKPIPGAEIVYTILVTNSGAGSVDNNTIVIIDTVPANTSICVSNTCSNPPVAFSCSVTPACGLTYDYAADVIYLDESDNSYTPAPDAAGYDALARKVRINPKGVFNGSADAPYPNFSISFKVKMQ